MHILLLYGGRSGDYEGSLLSDSSIVRDIERFTNRNTLKTSRE